LASYLTQEVDPTVFLLYDGGVVRIGFAVGSIVLGIYFHDLYSRIQVKSRILLAQQLSPVMIGIALLAEGVIGYLDGDLILPRRLMLLASALTLISVFALARPLQHVPAQGDGGTAAVAGRRQQGAG